MPPVAHLQNEQRADALTRPARKERDDESHDPPTPAPDGQFP